MATKLVAVRYEVERGDDLLGVIEYDSIANKWEATTHGESPRDKTRRFTSVAYARAWLATT